MRRVVGLLAGLSLWGSLLVTPVEASLTCNNTVNDSVGPSSGPVYVLGYEAHNYAVTPVAHAMVLCFHASTTGGLSISNFKNIGYSGPDGECENQLLPSYGTWNDCLSSLKVSIDCHHSVTLYVSSDYDTSYPFLSFTTSQNVASLGFPYDDGFSSIRIYYHSTCITGPGQ